MNLTTTTPADEISRLHGEIIEAARKTLHKAIRIGELLTEQKRSLPHGSFGRWIRDALPFGERTARNYMRLHRERRCLKTENVSGLADAYRMLLSHQSRPALKPPTPRELRELRIEQLETEAALGRLILWAESRGIKDTHKLGWLFELTEEQLGQLYFDLKTADGMWKKHENVVNEIFEQTPEEDLRKAQDHRLATFHEHVQGKIQYDDVFCRADAVIEEYRERETAWDRLIKLAKAYKDEPDSPITLTDIAHGICCYAA